MSKQRRSMLDPYREALMEMDIEKKPLAEMLDWLETQGVSCALSTIADFLDGERYNRLHSKLLENIMTGARQCRDVEKLFGKNPAPALETLIKLHRVIILKLSTQGDLKPQSLKLADQLLRTAMEFIHEQIKISHKERELQLAEDKFQIAFCEKILNETTRLQAERIAASNMTQAEKIAALRKVAFQDVEALEQSGKLEIPKA